MIESMTALDVNIAIKHGITTPELLLEYDCTQEQFDNQLRKLFSNESTRKKKKRDLRSNEKIHRKEEVPAEDDVVEASTTEPVENATDESIPENVTTEPSAEVTSVGTLLEAISLQKEKLSKQIADKKEELNQIELIHKEHAQARTDIRANLRAYLDRLTRIHKDCLAIRQKAHSEINQLNIYAEKMQELNEPIGKAREEIDRLETEFREGGNAVILAFDSGEIQLNDIKITEFVGWEELYAELRARDDLDDRLALFQLKQLAKLMTTTKQLEERGISYEVMFDSEVLEHAYHNSHQ